MTERTSYEHGTPCWVEYGSPDLDASIGFYGALFGWEVPEQPELRAAGRLPAGESATAGTSPG